MVLRRKHRKAGYSYRTVELQVAVLVCYATLSVSAIGPEEQ